MGWDCEDRQMHVPTNLLHTQALGADTVHLHQKVTEKRVHPSALSRAVWHHFLDVVIAITRTASLGL